MTTKIRPLSIRRDKAALQRTWQECGWIEDTKKHKQALDCLAAASEGTVYQIGPAAECFVLSTPGRCFHTGTELSLAAITAVTTSRVARNQGAASLVLGDRLSRDAAGGAAIAGLGMFEQGFYDRLGFGSGPYEHWTSFDPAWLIDLPKPEMPLRFDESDYQKLHAARLKRRRTHGGVNLLPADITRGDMLWTKNSFGLGYSEGSDLSHYVVLHTDSPETGPYTVSWMVYRTLADMVELLALLSGLGDQVRQIRMREPRDVQMQDFLRKPFQLQQITRSGTHEARTNAIAYWQMRILQLESCIPALECPHEVRFNLRLKDPIEGYLPQGSTWAGCGGEYLVSLGTPSRVQPGGDADLPTLEASVGPLTRFWLGAKTAEALSLLDGFRAPPALVADLDRAVGLPSPDPDWDY